jgi:hypothetical protein
MCALKPNVDSLVCLLQKVWSRREYNWFYWPFLGTAPWWPLSRGTCPGNSEESEGNPGLDSNTWLTILLIQVVEIQCHGCVDCYTLAANFTRVLKCLSKVLQTLVTNFNMFFSSFWNLTCFFLMQLYAESMARFQGGSPYIYPLYGLGELPQVFWTCIVSVFKVLYEPFPAS